jgi:DNA repair protein RecN (Recombination protein N)
MGEYASHVESDPARLDHIRKRQDLLFRLKARYGPELDDVLTTLQRARSELDLLDTAQYDRSALSKELELKRAAHLQLCHELSERRRSAARLLVRDVNALLPDLGMPGGRFAVDLASVAAPGSHGAENIEFRITVNAGFEPRPLARVASGGELSRVMLALKCILARVDRAPTLVFDEVDVGIGGRVAHRVAETLRMVAAAHQVLVVTHLPQIASRADHHLLVEKTAAEGRTATAVHELSGDARVHELARLLGGDPESAASLQHARELLTLASG